MIENKFRPLPAAVALIAVATGYGSAPLAQNGIDANTEIVEQAMSPNLDELIEFLGPPANNAETVRLLRLAAEQGDADAQLQLGRTYASGIGVPQDDAVGVRWIRLAAEQGHADAQLALGAAYSLGRGVLRDEAEAVRWRRRAAEQGHVGAYLSLGFAYSEGQGVLKDKVEAARWYRLAVQQGDTNAQVHLGFLYQSEGVLKDYVLAHMWLNIASANGVDLIGLVRDRIESYMTPDEILRATELARTCMASGYRTCEP